MLAAAGAWGFVLDPDFLSRQRDSTLPTCPTLHRWVHSLLLGLPWGSFKEEWNLSAIAAATP